MNHHDLPFALATALLLVLSAAGCNSGGSGSRDAILGGPAVYGMAPLVTALAPASGATGVPANLRMVTAQFNMAVDPGTATFTLTAPGQTPAGTVALDPTGRIATFTLAAAASFTPGAVYTATLAGARSASSGLVMPSPWSGSFTMGSSPSATLPRVASTRPATTLPGPTTGASGASVEATFTKDMNPATLAFTLAATGSGATAGTASYSVGSRTFTFAPASPLLPSTTYTATILASASDLTGLHLAGNTAALPASSNYTWSFTTTATLEVVAPMVVLEFPADKAVSVPLDGVVSAAFSEDMAFAGVLFTLQPAAGAPLSGDVTYDPLTRTATFAPSVPLMASTAYTATLTGGRDLAGNALAAGTLPNPWTFTTGTALAASRRVDLGAAASFGIMATSAIASTGATTINGDVSLAPGTSITGFPPGVVNGVVHVNDASAALAKASLLTAFNTASALAPGTVVAAGADLGAAFPKGLPPGTYSSPSTLLISTPVTLDAGGDANAVWVFRIGSSLTSASGIVLVNGARAGNVFWVPVLDATLGAGSVFRGTILAGRDVTSATGATIYGRILAGAATAGTITLDTTTINVPAN